MKTIIEKLIRRKFYKSAEVATKKVTTIYLANVIGDDEYAELMGIIEEVYGDES